MGKKDASLNIPENSSLSLTLNSLCTYVDVRIQASDQSSLRWLPELPAYPSVPCAESKVTSPVLPPFKDSDLIRVSRHFERVKKRLPEIYSPFELEYREDWASSAAVELRTANTFPASSGIASSASSFAGMTLAFLAAYARDLDLFKEKWEKDFSFRRTIAQVSRMGSGSSCRSFEGPWVVWEGERSQEFQAPQLPPVSHFVVLIQTLPKKVSSSEAHSLVRTSPLWQGRVERVESRLAVCKKALHAGDFSALARVAWAETWEMHSLFHTAADPFTYWAPGTVLGLTELGKWINTESPPLVTLDAGPNIHVIVESHRRSEWRERLRECFSNSVILEDKQGQGARFF